MKFDCDLSTTDHLEVTHESGHVTIRALYGGQTATIYLKPSVAKAFAVAIKSARLEAKECRRMYR